MRRWLAPLACSCSLLLLLAAAGPATEPESQPETATGAPEGFISLFDGSSLEGWKPVNTEGNFHVRDGVLVMDRGAGWLASERTFGDFELRTRYRFITPGADSGLFIRSSLEGTNWTSRGYQVQNMDNQTLGMFVGMGVPVQGQHDKEAVRRFKKPTGEWMELTIIARGKQGRVLLDGQEVASSEDLWLDDGHIGLQAEGGVLEFQRIDIRPLEPAATPQP